MRHQLNIPWRRAIFPGFLICSLLLSMSCKGSSESGLAGTTSERLNNDKIGVMESWSGVCLPSLHDSPYEPVSRSSIVRRAIKSVREVQSRLKGVTETTRSTVTA